MTERDYTVAVVGATGVVGGAVRAILEQRAFPVGELRLLASARSRGAQLTFRGSACTVGELAPGAFAGVDLAFFAAGGAASKEFVPQAVAAGAVAIDKSSAFRADPAVPLVVPEVNADHLERHKGVIATPNCSTIQMVVALKPIHDAAGVERVVVSTYQSVSGSGKRGVDDLDRQARAWATGADPALSFYPHRIAFNLLPHIDSFLSDGSTKEEQKMVDETVKIFADPGIRVTATCVRVPVFGAHSESLNMQTREPLGAAAARELLAAASGVEVIDDPSHGRYPTPLDAEGKDPVFVGRIRDDDTAPNCLNFWVVADNLRKGAALNAVQIAEALVARGLL
jgi:aspartate-semialdehyde dehydrogenase